MDLILPIVVLFKTEGLIVLFFHCGRLFVVILEVFFHQHRHIAYNVTVWTNIISPPNELCQKLALYR